MKSVTSLLLLVTIFSVPAFAQSPKSKVDFNRDIRPIFAEFCYQCHGPDDNKRKADLRLDLKGHLFADRDGTVLVSPRDLKKSELFARVISKDADEQMPPRDKGEALSSAQIDLLRRWIEQGAAWKGHWAYEKLARPDTPTAEASSFVRNEVDRFVSRRLTSQGLKPANVADRATLIRRLSFDLTGLPPTWKEVTEFVADKRPDAYEKLVDRLLASPHYGERMSAYWLDIVRYADTGGYHSDNGRDVWMYRDYVIRAFNSNKPFDQFTIEQLAGDLLPKPTVEQRVASGYNRLLMTTEEGGAQAKEYTAKYAADRVRNVSGVWMGATMGCCECHNHKYDPLTTKDFYSLAAFFADVQERAVGRQAQTRLPSPEQTAALAKSDAGIAKLKKVIATATPALAAAQSDWEAKLTVAARNKTPKNVKPLLAVAADKRNAKQKAAIATYYRSIAPLLAETRKQLAGATAQRAAVDRQIPTSLISTTGKPRTMRILARGNWLDDSGEVVLPAVPASLGTLDIGKRRGTRLDLARWFVSKDNPLTARVFVNRIWKLSFGQGLVKSIDDFGTQGEMPSHPELLDWLSGEFIASGWDIKKLHKLMVMSGTYRQSSNTPPALRERDPYNALLARQNRFRLDAEMVRDNAIAVSGLLARKIGGKSVRPYQPAGYWAHLNFPKRTYKHDVGESQYRRGLYTWWQRTFPHPSLLAFDAPSREECTAERSRSNNPLQALVLLNDPTYVESARTLAERIVKEGGKTPASRVTFTIRTCLSREPLPAEIEILTQLYVEHEKQYQADPQSAAQLLAIGLHPVAKDASKPELAAWTSVARTVMNLHEAIMRN
jgi:cytochrome c553